MGNNAEIQALIDTLKSGEKDKQAKAAAQLTQMGPEAIALLRPLLQHPELRVRMLASLALSELEQ